MKYFYVFYLLLVFSSCKNKERELLLKTQNEYILELEENNRLIFDILQKKMSENLLIIDTKDLKEYKIAFDNNYNDIQIENFNSYTEQRNILISSLRDCDGLRLFKSKEIKLIKPGSDSIGLNKFKLSVLKDFNKISKLLLNTYSTYNCGFNTEMEVSFHITEIDCKESFLKKGKIFLTGAYEKMRFDKVYFGKLDTTFFKFSNIYSDKVNSYVSSDLSDLRLEVFEQFDVDYYNGEDYFSLSKLKKTYENNIEGLMRTDSPFGGYEYIAFRYTFN